MKPAQGIASIIVVLIVVLSVAAGAGAIYFLFLSKITGPFPLPNDIPSTTASPSPLPNKEQSTKEIKWIASDNKILPFSFSLPTSIRLVNDFGEGTYYQADYSDTDSYDTCTKDPECFYITFTMALTTEDNPEGAYNSPDVKKSEVSDIPVGSNKSQKTGPFGDGSYLIQSYARMKDFEANGLIWIVSDLEKSAGEFKFSRIYDLEINKELYTIRLDSSSKQTVEKNISMVEQIVSSVKLKAQ